MDEDEIKCIYDNFRICLNSKNFIKWRDVIEAINNLDTKNYNKFILRDNVDSCQIKSLLSELKE